MFKFTSLIFFSLFIVYHLLFITPVSAHLAGQPPYFKINGVYSNLYDVPITSVPDLALPQDIAVSNYLVDQSINFAFDVNALPAPKEVIDKTTFSWDFGDGTKGSGLANTHSYKKMGSFTVIIYAQDSSNPTPQVIQSVLINIVSDSNYKLPKAAIKVNNKQSKDPLTDVLRFSFKKPLTLDGLDSKSSSKIASFFWDFGDGTSSNNSKENHSYSESLYQTFPVLRIKNIDGFISDVYVEVQNEDLARLNPQPTESPSPTVMRQNSFVLFRNVLIACLLLLVIFFTVRLLLRARGRGRSR